MTKTKNVYNKALKILLIVLCGAIFLKLSLTYGDTDLHYLLANGQYILKHGIPTTNPFIGAEGVPIVIQNYAWCMVLALFYDIFGNFGLIFLNGVVISYCIVIGVFLLNENDKLRKAPLYTKILGMMFAIILGGYISLRPQILTTALILAQCLALERFKNTGKAIHLVTVPIVMLFEANLHASYIAMHLAFGACYIVPGFSLFGIKDKSIGYNTLYEKNGKIVRKKRPTLLAAGSFVLGLLASLANPYGFKNITYVFEALFDRYMDKWVISEQQPVNIANSTVFSTVVLLLVVLCIMMAKKWADSLAVYTTLPIIGLTLITVKWISFAPISIIYLVMSASDLVDTSLLKKVFSGNIFKRAMCLLSAFLILGTVFAGVKAATYAVTASKQDSPSPVSEFYEKSLDYIKAHNPDGVVFCEGFEHANYYEFKGIKVYLDARPELYKGELAEKYLTIDRTYNPFDKDSLPLSLKEYTSEIESTNADYFVIDRHWNFILFGLENSDIYREVEDISCEEFAFYEKI